MVSPTSTTTSALSSARDLDRYRIVDTDKNNFTSRMPTYEPERASNNRTVEVERTTTNHINRTVIKPTARYL